MAFTVPDHPSALATSGERKVFAALRDHLPEDYLIYYDIRVKGRYPDFVVIGPDLGVVVLEVKDWRLPTIAETRPDGVVVKRSDGEHFVRHPLHQARDYIVGAVDLLKQRPALCVGDRLAFGWGFGVVLPNMKRADIETPSLFGPTLEEALGVGLVLTADDLAPERLPIRLRDLLPRWATSIRSLSPNQIDEIRAVLYPEVRLGWGRSDAEIVEVMDREQERVARSLGDGHRLLRGVAGSGKTVTLVCRARHLRARHPTWRILVLCFNRVLAEVLATAIGTDEKLDVSTFHAWCARELRRAGIAMPPPPERGPAWQEYWDEVPQLLLQAYADGRVATATYQAVLIDEGQDFADDWYRAVLNALDPESNSLFLALDASQNIYRRRVSWRGLGIQASGRTRVMRVNYRNTRPILDAAYGLISELDSTRAREPEDEFVVPDRAVRTGPPPQIIRHVSFEVTRRFTLDWIRTRLARGIPPEGILVLTLIRPEIERLTSWLNSMGIPASLLEADASPGTVKLSTIHGAKGLDAAHVLVIRAHEPEQRDESEGRRLLYIAMTRARDELCVCYHRDSPVMAELERAIDRLGAMSADGSLHD